MAASLADLTSGELGKMVMHHFPDGESYVRVQSDVKRRDVFIVCTLVRPDPLLAPLLFAAETVRSLGARSVGLIAPYLSYMRQDRIFRPGEASTAQLFARLVQQHFENLVTVDPHLHRLTSLDEIYDIPSLVVAAGPLLAAWVADNIDEPLIVGPDHESAQWVKSVADAVGAPWTLFSKERKGDRSVRITAPDLRPFQGRTPVVVDDIVSSGATVRGALAQLRGDGMKPAYCLAVHRICTARVARAISDRAVRFLTTNTAGQCKDELDVAPLIAQALIAQAAKALT